MEQEKTQIVCSFYKYVDIESPDKVRKEQTDLCRLLNLKGRILIGKEGINGSVCGQIDSVEEYKKYFGKNPLFLGIGFNEQESKSLAFRKLIIRVRREIVHFGTEADPKKTARLVSPKDFKELMDKKEDIVLLDVRNSYESRIGKFMNSMTLDIKNFREFPKAILGLKDLREKKIITYCTGGIRCEKASALMIDNGFSCVLQLQGGILAYGKEFPDTYWEGRCFVFDDRVSIHINQKNTEPLAKCDHCAKKCDDYLNCHNLDCDKLFLCCNECRTMYNNSCSQSCKTSQRRRKSFILNGEN